MTSISDDSPASTVAVDLLCRECGYNLRTLATKGVCPECGAPIALSLRSDLLQFSQPQWLDKLRYGINCIIVADISAFIFAFGYFRRSHVVGANSFTPVAMGLLSALGTWWLTVPEPGGVGEAQYGTSRRVLRAFVWFEIVRVALRATEKLIAIGATYYQIIAIVLGVISLAGVIADFAELRYLSRLAKRIPDEKLARRAWFLMYALTAASAAVTLIIQARAVLTAIHGTRPLDTKILLFLLIVPILCCLVFMAMYLILLFRYSKRLRAAAIAARAVWNASGTPVPSPADFREPLVAELPPAP